MDTTDMNLIMLLSANSRLPYAQLAEGLHLSVNAVHKRIQLLLETGVIRKFTAKVSLYASKALIVFISGVSTLPLTSSMFNRYLTQKEFSIHHRDEPTCWKNYFFSRGL